MSEEKVSTKEIAEQLLPIKWQEQFSEASVDFSEFISITDDAAEILGAYPNATPFFAAAYG